MKFGFSMRTVLIGFLILNAVAIGLSEVQRRSLINLTNAIQAKRFNDLDARLTDMEKRQLRLFNWYGSRVDRALSTTKAEDDASGKTQAVELARQRDRVRARHAMFIQELLAQYYGAKKSYPQLPDNAVDDVAPILASVGLVTTIPRDPLTGISYRYSTDGASNGQSYGLKISLENGGDCLTGVNFEDKGWWGAIPICPF